jgi:hypothetical protein
MQRAELQDFTNATMLRLEGRLVGSWADSVLAMAKACPFIARLLVDLTDVSYVDGSGEEVLKSLADIGAEFAAESCYSRDLCERLVLPQERKTLAPRSLAAGDNGSPHCSLRPDTGDSTARPGDRPSREVHNNARIAEKR